MSWQKKVKWIEARTAALLAYTDDPALAALVAGPREIELIMAQLKTPIPLRIAVERLRSDGLWTEEAQRGLEANTRATIELALLDHHHAGGLPIVELARRCAAIVVAQATGKDTFEVCAIAARMCAGSGGGMRRWVCSAGHGGVLVAVGVEAAGAPCPDCGKPIKIVRED